MSNGGRFHPVPNEGIAPRAWGLDANRISTITIELGTARTHKEIRIGGNFLWASDATDGAATMTLAFTESEADAGITFKRGSMVAGMRYGKVFVTNAVQAGKTITLTYAVEAPELRIANPAGFFTDISIAKQLFPWEGRSPLNIFRKYAVLGRVPAGGTVQATYTVPAGKQAIMRSANLSVIRRTAATAALDVAGTVYAPFATNQVVEARISHDNTVGARVHVFFNDSLWLQAADVLDIATADNSTGGTVDYFLYVNLIEFDA